jgi:hypothetical protein
MLTSVEHKYSIRKASFMGYVRKALFRILFKLLVFTRRNFSSTSNDCRMFAYVQRLAHANFVA